MKIIRCGTKALICIIILILILLIANNIVSIENNTSVIINEVMPNPTQDDNYNEWIELFNPTDISINISEWTITDNYSEDTIQADDINGDGSTIIPPKSYAILTDQETKVYENFSIPKNIINLNVDDKSIGNGLGNTKDKLILKDESGNIIDTLEWGENYNDIPGEPIEQTQEGNTIARYIEGYTNNTYNDFFESLNPTPGYENIKTIEPDIFVEKYPSYISKIKNNTENSIPFSIKIRLGNYKPNEFYQMKTYIVGVESNRYPASQTWDDTQWSYSDRYTHNISTDENGNWTGWVNLRLKSEYAEYQNNIRNNNHCFIKIKTKNENFEKEICKKIYLLDIDNKTKNGIKGGYIIGRAENNVNYLEGYTILLENINKNITAIYQTENNNIDDCQPTNPGYYKLASPIDKNYTIKIFNEEDEFVKKIENIEIKYGSFGIELTTPESTYYVINKETKSIPIEIRNIGNFSENISLSIKDLSIGWNAELQTKKLYLEKGDKKTVYLKINNLYETYKKIKGSIEISSICEEDFSESDSVIIKFEVLGPDLIFRKIQTFNEEKEEDKIFLQGENIRIKTFLKNQGNQNATNVKINFYYDEIDDDHFIGCKKYENIANYQKYPSIEIDTSKIKSGIHSIIVIVDEEKTVSELDEANNQIRKTIKIIDTSPNELERKILISEIYYHSHTNIHNEFIKIFNPTDNNIDISGWYITNNPSKIRLDQTKIVFPNNTIINANNSILLSEDSAKYLYETGRKPDFEYNVDSDEKIPQMNNSKKFIMPNIGGIIVLKNPYNHTIDAALYGEKNNTYNGWKGNPINDSGMGNILKRNKNLNDFFVDTNSSSDWFHPKTFCIGHSDFLFEKNVYDSVITTFVSPDNSYNVIIDEIKNANQSIYLNIYEFTNTYLCDKLIDALKRDVFVNVFVEGGPIGGISDEEIWILNKINNYGGKVNLILGDSKNNIFSRYNFNHAKYLIIDNETVIVESCNWAKTGVPIDPSFGNREWGIVVKNKEIAGLYLDVFMDDCNTSRCDIKSFDQVDFNLPLEYMIVESYPKGDYNAIFDCEKISGNIGITPVFSPDNSYNEIIDLIDSAEETIYIQQLYIYKNWSENINPFVEKLIEKAQQKVDIKIMMNYNPFYDTTNEKINETKRFFEENDIEVKFLFTNYSIFTNLHNKGVIIDNKTVLISSINWNENSVTKNREAGIIIDNETVSKYYASVFFYDWDLKNPSIFLEDYDENINYSNIFDKNTIYIVVIFTITFGLIARDWRKRKWT